MIEKKEGIVIDATNAILGRLASHVAKLLLSGKRVIIVNSEKALIIGNKKNILEKYRKKRSLGRGSLKGPYFPRKPEAILRRTVRGMLPYKTSHGKEAFKRLKCYTSIPEKYINTAQKITARKIKTVKYITLEELSKLI